MRRPLTILAAGTMLLAACGGEAETTQTAAAPAAAGDAEAFEAFAACLEEQGIEAGGVGARGGFGGQRPDGVPAQPPTELPTDLPTDLPSGAPTDLPTDRPEVSTEDMAARQACAEEAGIGAGGGFPGGGRMRPGAATEE